MSIIHGRRCLSTHAQLASVLQAPDRLCLLHASHCPSACWQGGKGRRLLGTCGWHGLQDGGRTPCGRPAHRQLQNDAALQEGPQLLGSRVHSGEEHCQAAEACHRCCWHEEWRRIIVVLLDNAAGTVAKKVEDDQLLRCMQQVARCFNQAYGLQLSVRGEMECAYQGERLTPSLCGRMVSEHVSSCTATRLAAHRSNHL